MQTFEEAVLPLYDTYVKMATKWCYGDVHRAEDMVQEAMMKAFAHYSEYDEKYKISTWFHQILRNTVMDHFKVEERAKGHFQEYFTWKETKDPFYSMELTEEEAVLQDFSEKLPSLLRTLTPVDQTIIQMYMAGETQNIIAQTIGTSRGAIAQRITRICRKLKEELTEEPC